MPGTYHKTMQESSNIVSLFTAAAQKHADTVAIIDANKQLTYAELLKDVEATAAYFREKGVQKGDRILVFIPMGADLYRTVLALFYAGATAVFLDEWVDKKRLENCCDIADCKGFAASFKIRFMALSSANLRRMPLKLSPGKRKTPEAGQQAAAVSPDDTALITFTTGSTGKPKAANRTHGFLHEQFKALEPLINNGRHTDMPMLPIVLLLNLALGKSSVIADYKASKPQSFDPAHINAQIQKQQVNSITASPYYLLSLAKHLVQQHQKSTVSFVISGGAPVFPKDAEILMEAFPAADINLVYGSTEAEPISKVKAQELVAFHAGKPMKGLMAGYPDAAAQVRIISSTRQIPSSCSESEFSSLQLRPGENGEIIVSGKHVLSSYINNPEAEALNKIKVDGTVWHRTGDGGFMDTEGRLFLSGRCKQVITYEGSVYYPFIIEYLLQQCEGIRTGTIVMYENKPVIVVEPKADFEMPALSAHLEENGLGNFLPRVVTAIPRDPRHHSKIDYEALNVQVQRGDYLI